MKICVVGCDDSFFQVVHLVIDCAVEAEVICFRSLEKFAETCDLVILDHASFSGKIDLKEFIDRVGLIPVILRVDETLPTPLEIQRCFGFFNKNFMIEPLHRLIDQWLIKYSDVDTQSKNAEYIKIRLPVLLNFPDLPCDGYVKLSDDKYLKILQSGDTLNLADVQRYTKNGVKFFYVKCVDFSSLLNKVVGDLAVFRAVKESSLETRIEFLGASLDAIQNASQILGFSQEISAAVENCVTYAVNLFQQTRELDSLIETLQLKEGFYANYSVMLAHMSCGLAARRGWTSELTQYKLTLAAFLHNFPILNKRSANFRTIDEFVIEMAGDNSEFADFQEHPIKCADLARSLRGIPTDVDTILAQHHERPNGTGFPMKLTHSEIHPLACCFILGQELTCYMIAHRMSWNVSDFLKNMRPIYDVGPFKEFLRCLVDRKVA